MLHYLVASRQLFPVVPGFGQPEICQYGACVKARRSNGTGGLHGRQRETQHPGRPGTIAVREKQFIGFPGRFFKGREPLSDGSPQIYHVVAGSLRLPL
jgi:hypothetical protein